MWCHLLTETQQLVAVVIDRRGKEAQLKLVDTAGGVTGQTVGDVFGRAAQGVIGLALDGIAQADRLAQHAHCKRLVDSSGRLAQLTDALNRGPHTALRWPLRKPAVTQLGGAPHRRRRGSTHPDRRAARACRGRANPHRGGRITLADKAEPGVDVDENVYPQEARLEDAFSLTKGCYIGQEVVAKIDTYGGLNKRLVALRISHDDPVARGTRLLRLDEGEWRDLGVVTSWAYSFVLDTGLVLAYVKRRHQKIGTEFRVGDGPASAVIVALPVRAGALPVSGAFE